MAKPPTKGPTLKEPGIYALSANRWKVRVAPWRNGRQVQRQVTVQGTIADARAARARLLAEALEEAQAAAHETPGVPTPRTSVTVYCEHWIAGRGARLKPSTRARYVEVLARQVLPRIGEHRVCDVTRGTVEAWVTQAEALRLPGDKPYSQHTLLGWWRVLVEVLRDAAAELHLPDPTARVKPPSRATAPRRERQSLTRDELHALVGWVDAARPSWSDEIYVLAYTGMRAGELYALTWAQIRFDRECIEVNRAHWRGEVGTTKTVVGRIVPLTAEMARRLQERRVRLGAAQGIVFPSTTGGHRLAQATHKLLREASRELGLPVVVTPQVLRRTMNNLLRQAGVDRIEIRDIIGHTTEAMTERYAHSALEAKRKGVEAVESRRP